MTGNCCPIFFRKQIALELLLKSFGILQEFHCICSSSKIWGFLTPHPLLWLHNTWMFPYQKYRFYERGPVLLKLNERLQAENFQAFFYLFFCPSVSFSYGIQYHLRKIEWEFWQPTQREKMEIGIQLTPRCHHIWNWNKSIPWPKFWSNSLLHSYTMLQR